MQKLKSIKREKSGITLISLVITIIVLLILAGVTLNALLGDSGILNNAQRAKEQTIASNNKEQIQLVVQSILIKGNDKITGDKLKEELNKTLDDYTISGSEGNWIVSAGGVIVEVSSDGTTIIRDTETLKGIIKTKGTTPWLPEGFSRVTKFTEGLVISNTTNGTEGTQSYVWIEVPTTEQTITLSNGTTQKINLSQAKTDEEIIEALELYAGKGTNSDYTKGARNQSYSSWKEEWYDFYNATWDGESKYAYIGVSTTSASMVSSQYPFAKWNEYYRGEVYVGTSKDAKTDEEMTRVDFTTAAYSNTAYYFTKVNANFKNHSDGCGMTYNEYQTAYSKMLNSIKTYGGFWISQYEAGIAYEENGKTSTNRTNSSPRITNPTSANYAKDQYPYNYVYCSEAQKIANADSTNEYTSSIPFGIQWDLLCKLLEVKKAKTYAEIATNSTWGNYSDILYTPSRTAKYSTNYGGKFNPVVEEGTIYSKTASGHILLTTGAIEETTTSTDASPMDIYNLAGNVCEWTLERAISVTSNPCAYRSGNYNDNSSDYPTSSRDYSNTHISSNNSGFRSVLY